MAGTYQYGTMDIDKDDLLQSITENVTNYIKYKGWNARQAEAFRASLQRITDKIKKDQVYSENGALWDTTFTSDPDTGHWSNRRGHRSMTRGQKKKSGYETHERSDSKGNTWDSAILYSPTNENGEKTYPVSIEAYKSMRSGKQEDVYFADREVAAFINKIAKNLAIATRDIQAKSSGNDEEGEAPAGFLTFKNYLSRFVNNGGSWKSYFGDYTADQREGHLQDWLRNYANYLTDAMDYSNAPWENVDSAINGLSALSDVIHTGIKDGKLTQNAVQALHQLGFSDVDVDDFFSRETAEEKTKRGEQKKEETKKEGEEGGKEDTNGLINPLSDDEFQELVNTYETMYNTLPNNSYLLQLDFDNPLFTYDPITQDLGDVYNQYLQTQNSSLAGEPSSMRSSYAYYDTLAEKRKHQATWDSDVPVTYTYDTYDPQTGTVVIRYKNSKGTDVIRRAPLSQLGDEATAWLRGTLDTRRGVKTQKQGGQILKALAGEKVRNETVIGEQEEGQGGSENTNNEEKVEKPNYSNTNIVDLIAHLDPTTEGGRAGLEVIGLLGDAALYLGKTKGVQVAGGITSTSVRGIIQGNDPDYSKADVIKNVAHNALLDATALFNRSPEKGVKCIKQAISELKQFGTRLGFAVGDVTSIINRINHIMTDGGEASDYIGILSDISNLFKASYSKGSAEQSDSQQSKAWWAAISSIADIGTQVGATAFADNNTPRQKEVITNQKIQKAKDFYNKNIKEYIYKEGLDDLATAEKYHPHSKEGLWLKENTDLPLETYNDWQKLGIWKNGGTLKNKKKVLKGQDSLEVPTYNSPASYKPWGDIAYTPATNGQDIYRRLNQNTNVGASLENIGREANDMASTAALLGSLDNQNHNFDDLRRDYEYDDIDWNNVNWGKTFQYNYLDNMLYDVYGIKQGDNTAYDASFIEGSDDRSRSADLISRNNFESGAWANGQNMTKQIMGQYSDNEEWVSNDIARVYQNWKKQHTKGDTNDFLDYYNNNILKLQNYKRDALKNRTGENAYKQDKETAEFNRLFHDMYRSADNIIGYDPTTEDWSGTATLVRGTYNGRNRRNLNFSGVQDEKTRKALEEAGIGISSTGMLFSLPKSETETPPTTKKGQRVPDIDLSKGESKFRMGFFDIKPEMTDLGRLIGTLWRNKKLDHPLPVLLTDPMEKRRQVQGDHAAIQRARQEAAKIRHRAATPMTADIDKQRAYELEAEGAAQKVEQQGYAQNDAAVKESVEKNWEQELANQKSRYETAMANRARLHQYKMARLSMKDQHLIRDWASIDDYLGRWEDRFRESRETRKGLYEKSRRASLNNYILQNLAAWGLDDEEGTGQKLINSIISGERSSSSLSGDELKLYNRIRNQVNEILARDDYNQKGIKYNLANYFIQDDGTSVSTTNTEANNKKKTGKKRSGGVVEPDSEKVAIAKMKARVQRLAIRQKQLAKEMDDTQKSLDRAERSARNYIKGMRRPLK